MHLAYLVDNAGLSCRQAHSATVLRWAMGPICRHTDRRRRDIIGPTNLQIGGEPHDQVRQPLRELWRKVWPCLPLSLGAALLPQSLQGQLPRENSQGLCVHQKVAWLTRAHSVSTEIQCALFFYICRIFGRKTGFHFS